MPDGDFRLGLRSSTAVGVVEALMRPAVILAEVLADVVRGCLLAVAYVARGTAGLMRALVRPVLYACAAATLLGIGAAGGYGLHAYQIMPARAAKPIAGPSGAAAPQSDLPDGDSSAPQPQGDQSPPFGPRITPPPADPFGMR